MIARKAFFRRPRPFAAGVIAEGDAPPSIRGRASGESLGGPRAGVARFAYGGPHRAVRPAQGPSPPLWEVV
ncbi:hypothetical protein Acsp03_05100 [Actinomadura sp. NBRC 104412]|nr:hypothetical protein Acsp03_05100 [Actinomadura sp. NBRC 104412]